MYFTRSPFLNPVRMELLPWLQHETDCLGRQRTLPLESGHPPDAEEIGTHHQQRVRAGQLSLFFRLELVQLGNAVDGSAVLLRLRVEIGQLLEGANDFVVQLGFDLRLG